jgi:hypothetical protein
MSTLAGRMQARSIGRAELPLQSITEILNARSFLKKRKTKPTPRTPGLNFEPGLAVFADAAKKGEQTFYSQESKGARRRRGIATDAVFEFFLTYLRPRNG